jgi:hypothetical protein
MSNEIKDRLVKENPSANFAEGLEEAFIGIGRRVGMPAVAVYDYAICVGCFIDQGISQKVAERYFEFNVVVANENAPIFVETGAERVPGFQKSSEKAPILSKDSAPSIQAKPRRNHFSPRETKQSGFGFGKGKIKRRSDPGW